VHRYGAARIATIHIRLLQVSADQSRFFSPNDIGKQPERHARCSSGVGELSTHKEIVCPA
jgi:hypothetical protein